MLKINLAKREKYIVIIVGCLIGVFFLTNFIILPFFEEKDRLRKGITAKEQELEEIAALIADYQKYEKGSSDISKILSERAKGFTLTSYLDNAARKTGVADHLTEMKANPSKGSGPYEESMVELKLEGINPDQLVNYLYSIENPETLVFIRRITISDNKEEGYLDCIIRVLTYQ